MSVRVHFPSSLFILTKSELASVICSVHSEMILILFIISLISLLGTRNRISITLASQIQAIFDLLKVSILMIFIFVLDGRWLRSGDRFRGQVALGTTILPLICRGRATFLLPDWIFLFRGRRQFFGLQEHFRFKFRLCWSKRVHHGLGALTKLVAFSIDMGAFRHLDNFRVACLKQFGWFDRIILAFWW